MFCEEKNKDLEQVRENSRETLDSEEPSPEVYPLVLPATKNPRDPDLNMISAQTVGLHKLTKLTPSSLSI